MEVSYDIINRLKTYATLFAVIKSVDEEQAFTGHDKYPLRTALTVPSTFQNIKDYNNIK